MTLSLDYDSAASLASLWDELVMGRCKIVETFSTPEHCSLRLNRASPGPLSERQGALTRRQIDALELYLIGSSQKCVAIDFGLAGSSVAAMLQQCFRFMGLSCIPSRAPLMLVLAAHASAACRSRRSTPLKPWWPPSGEWVARVSRPDAVLESLLPPAEYAVIALLAEGKSYDEMARLRQTSVRTIANQVGAAFRRLRVSGRAQLLCLVARRTVESLQEAHERDTGMLAGRLANDALEPCQKQAIVPRVQRGIEVAIRQ